MTVLLFQLLPLFVCGTIIDAATLPPYIKPCYRNDPNFHTCTLEHGKEVLPAIVKGDRKVGLIKMDPLEIIELKIDNKGVIFILQNVSLIGLKSTQLEEVKFDFEKKKLAFTYMVPKLTVLGKYAISGHLLVLPINGKGDINCTSTEARLVNDANLTFQKRDGKEYMSVNKDINLNITVTRSYFHLTNLFNGNELLGREMNIFMNENWKEVNDEMMKPVVNVMAGVITDSINNVLDSIPMDILFPTKLN